MAHHSKTGWERKSSPQTPLLQEVVLSGYNGIYSQQFAPRVFSNLHSQQNNNPHILLPQLQGLRSLHTRRPLCLCRRLWGRQEAAKLACGCPFSVAGPILVVREMLNLQIWPPSVLNVWLAFICNGRATDTWKTIFSLWTPRVDQIATFHSINGNHWPHFIIKHFFFKEEEDKMILSALGAGKRHFLWLGMPMVFSCFLA